MRGALVFAMLWAAPRSLALTGRGPALCAHSSRRFGSNNFRVDGDDEILQSLRAYFRPGHKTLFVGEGDLGFSAFVARTFVGGDYTSSTWDTSSRLEASFPNASANVKSIIQSGGRVLYGVDATKLENLDQNFDAIVWMFPHVPGKQNIKRNRLLLHNFFKSAKGILAPGGHILLALAQGQSGFTSLTSNQDWLHSWKLSDACSEAGLLVTSVQHFSVDSLRDHGYSPQGHRGHGGSFPTRQAELFKLEPPLLSGSVVGVQAPVFCHEIHLLGSDMKSSSELEIAATDATKALFRDHGMPPALWTAHMVDLYVEPKSQLISHTVQLAYCSTEFAVGRSLADGMRELVERELPSRLGLKLRTEKAGGKVSKAHCWEIALALKGVDDFSGKEVNNIPAAQLSEALRELEPVSVPLDVDNPAIMNAVANAAFTRSYQDKTWGEQADEIRREARRLWQRRVGVLIHNVGK